MGKMKNKSYRQKIKLCYSVKYFWVIRVKPCNYNCMCDWPEWCVGVLAAQEPHYFHPPATPGAGVTLPENPLPGRLPSGGGGSKDQPVRSSCAGKENLSWSWKQTFGCLIEPVKYTSAYRILKIIHMSVNSSPQCKYADFGRKRGKCVLLQVTFSYNS